MNTRYSVLTDTEVKNMLTMVEQGGAWETSGNVSSEDDNVCTYCQTDRGESGILAVSECIIHYVSSDQCECPTDQVCFDCDRLDPSISNRIIFG